MHVKLMYSSCLSSRAGSRTRRGAKHESRTCIELYTNIEQAFETNRQVITNCNQPSLLATIVTTNYNLPLAITTTRTQAVLGRGDAAAARSAGGAT